MNDIFESKKTLEVLTRLYTLKETYPSKLSFDLGITYSYMAKIVKFLEDKDYIMSRKKGRVKYITLTTSGRNITKRLVELQKIAL